MSQQNRRSNMDLLISDPKTVDNFLKPYGGAARQSFGFENYQPPAEAPDQPFDWGGLVDSVRNYDPIEQNLGYMLKAGNYMRPSNIGERLYDLTDASFEPYMSDEQRAALPMDDPRRDAVSSLAIGAADVGAAAAVKAAPRVGREMLAATPDMLNLGYRKMGAPELPFEMNIFAGEKSLGGKSDDMLDLAKSLADGGIDRKQIYNATGWFKGTDDMWRQEIVDDMAIKSDAGRIGQMDFGSYDSMVDYGGVKGRYDDLFNETDFMFNPNSPVSSARPARGMHNAEIKIGMSNKSLDDLADTIGHETQHPIQNYEGFARGGTPDMADGMLKAESNSRMAALDDELKAVHAALGEATDPADIDMLMKARFHTLDRIEEAWGLGQKDPFQAYRSLAGEVEARNVGRRMGLSGDDRRMQYPWSTEDIPADEQLLRFDNKSLSMSVDEPPSYETLMKELDDVDNLPEKLKPQSGFSTPDDVVTSDFGKSIDNQIAQLEKETAGVQIHERGKGSSGSVGKSRDRVGTTGKYIGAPEGMDSPQKLGAMRKDYADTTKLGVAGRDWYDDSSEWINSVSPDSIVAKQHADSLAVTSAGTNVDTNLGFTVKGTVQDAAGVPVKTGRFPQNQSALLEEIHAGANPDLGMKRTPFAENLTVDWNPFVGDRAVHDIWQGRAMGYKGKNGKPFDRGFSPQEHAWMDQQMDVINDRLNAEDAGGFTDWNNLKTQASSWTGEKIKHGDILPEDAAMHYGSYSPKYQANATHEQVSGAGTGHLERMSSQTPEMRGDYSRDGASMWTDDKGRDMLYSDVGLMVEPDDAGVGVFRSEATGVMENNPVDISHPLINTEGKTGAKHVSPEARAIMDTVEGTRAYVDAQNAGAWHKLIAGNKAGESSSLTIPMSRPVSEAEMAKIADLAEKNGMFAVDTGRAVNLINDPYSKIGKKRTGVTLGKEVKGELGNDLKGLMPEAEQIQRVTADTGYIDYQGAWRAGEGSGEATTKLFSLFDNNPELLNRLDSSETLRKKALSNLDRDIEWAAKTGDVVRKDIQTARRIIAESGLKGLKRALDQGIALPAAVLGLTPLLMEETQDAGA